MVTKSVSELLQYGLLHLTFSSDTPSLDAEVLLAFVLNKDRAWLIAHRTDLISQSDQERYEECILRRKESEPVAYITGVREFYGLDFFVTPSVLIPRPETELLVSQTLKCIETQAKKKKKLTLLDLGTGSGCIAITLAKKSNVHITAIDLSTSALDVAKQNAEAHGVSNQITFVSGSWFEPVEGEKFDIIASNPPYVSKSESLAKDLDFEPESALFADEEGLSDLQFIMMNCTKYLNTNGALFLECGHDQAEKIRTLYEECRKKGFLADKIELTFHTDLQGIERVAALLH